MESKKKIGLLEYLVILIVVVFTVSLATVSFNRLKINSRDSKRRADILALQQAFEKYHDENKEYASCEKMVEAYIPGSYPEDPLESQSNYIEECSEKTYCICAQMEKDGSGNAESPDCSLGKGDWFCVENKQEMEG